jgi:tetratricopeptide (TPR) repeat protein
MKTDRRHELQTNELADSLARAIERLKPYGRAIAGALLGIVVLIALWFYMDSQAKASLEAGWDEFYEAEGNPNPQKLLEVIDHNPLGTPVGDWARVALGDRYLTGGVDQLFANKAEATNLLTKAVDQYNAVLGVAKDPFLKQKALFGVARAYESLGQLDQARGKYQELAAWPNGAYTAMAKQRLDDLNKPETKEWYAWFAQQEARPPAMQGPGTPGQKPSFDSLPNGPDIQLPTREPLLNQTDSKPDGTQPAAPDTTAPATTPQKSP